MRKKGVGAIVNEAGKMDRDARLRRVLLFMVYVMVWLIITILVLGHYKIIS